MDAIKFDGLYFLRIDKLVAYIVRRYGSLRGVPDSHPQIAIVSALHGLNEDYFFNLEGLGVARPRHDWPEDTAFCKHCGLKDQMWEERACSSITGHEYA